MKKLTLTLLSFATFNVFAATTESAVQTFDVNKLECHCEKHKMMFELKDGESLTEMSKHCTMNIDKKNSAVKFLDDNSGQLVKCNVANGKLEINTCKQFKHNKSDYTKSSKLTASEYSSASAH